MKRRTVFTAICSLALAAFGLSGLEAAVTRRKPRRKRRKMKMNRRWRRRRRRNPYAQTLTLADVRGAIARAYLHKHNRTKVMDPDLAEAAALEVMCLLRFPNAAKQAGDGPKNWASADQ